MKTNNKTEFRTESEIKREAKHKRICLNYLKYSKKHPDFRPHRIINMIATEENMTLMGIRSILIRYGLYNN